MGYDEKLHSKARLGIAGMVPAVPVMPTGVQISCATGMMHLRLLGDNYVRAGMPSISPGTYKGVVEAIKGCPLEGSWSGSPSQYFSLTVEPAEDGQGATIKAGEVVVGRVAVFDAAELVSADQSLEDQYKDAEPPTLPDPDAPPDTSVN